MGFKSGGDVQAAGARAFVAVEEGLGELVFVDAVVGEDDCGGVAEAVGIGEEGGEVFVVEGSAELCEGAFDGVIEEEGVEGLDGGFFAEVCEGIVLGSRVMGNPVASGQWTAGSIAVLGLGLKRARRGGGGPAPLAMKRLG